MSISQREAAKLLRVDRTTVQRRLRAARKRGEVPPGLTEDGHLSDETLAWLRGQGMASQPGRPPVGFVAPVASHVEPAISGLTADSRGTDPAELWQRHIADQARGEDKAARRYAQRVDIPDDRPVLLIIVGDGHIGNACTDYRGLWNLGRLAQVTDGAYVIIGGDIVDNWVGDRLEIVRIQGEQVMRHADELAMAEAWLAMLRGKVLAVVSGNHEMRTYDAVGVDLWQRFLGDAKALYDQHEVRWTMNLGASASWRFKLRHQWRGRSRTSSSYAPEMDARDRDGTWDVAISAHTHEPSCVRPFFDHVHDHRLKFCVHVGSWEYESTYGRELNCARSVNSGAVGLMLYPGGQLQPWHDLELAIDCLGYLRRRAA